MSSTAPSSDEDERELDETIENLERRGFEPVLVAFRDASGEVEVLTRGGVDLVGFVNWLALTWVPASRDRAQGGH